ncbi:MAG: hypothetical protein GXO66_09065 [Euryarchaeota archaeon]|nr:hypothetical protein [Euryarchaeota archaeon]
MPECRECGSHFLRHPLEISGWNRRLRQELPSLFRRRPTCPHCGLIGDIRRTKLKDALAIVKSYTSDERVVMNFMAFYRKRGKDFRDGYSVAMAFLENY